MTGMIRNTMRAAVTAACLIGMTSLASSAASAFEGVWKVKDTAGGPSNQFVQRGDREGDPRRGNDRRLEGEGNAAWITWKTRWTTKITKEGDE